MLQRILEDNAENWAVIYEELKKFRQRIADNENQPTYGLHRKKQMPFYRIFHAELFGNEELSEDAIGHLVNLTQQLSMLLESELRLTGFWDRSKQAAQNRLKGEIQRLLLSPEYHQLPNMKSKYAALVSRIMEIAETNNDILLYAE